MDRPLAIEAVQDCSYEARAFAHYLCDALLDYKRGYLESVLNEVAAHPRAREIVDCLARLALSSYMEHYGGQRGVVAFVVDNELTTAEELAHAEEILFAPETQTEESRTTSMKVKMLISVAGGFLNNPGGCSRNDIIDVDEAMADRLVNCGYAQRDWRADPGPAYQPPAQRGRWGWTDP